MNVSSVRVSPFSSFSLRPGPPGLLGVPVFPNRLLFLALPSPIRSLILAGFTLLKAILNLNMLENHPGACKHVGLRVLPQTV